MKRIYSLLVGVLLCTQVFAHGTKNSGTSSVAVTNSTGSTLFKLYYQAEKAGTVKVSIKNEHNETVYKETLHKVDAFIRPYNFEGLPEGQYTIVVEDEAGKAIEKVT